jgi:hypothetical protein
MTVERPRLFASRRRVDDAPRRGLGPGAAALAVVGAVATAVAVSVATGRDFPAATALAWTAIVVTAIAFVLGAAAIVLSRGRRWGVVAMVVAALANPLVLRLILRLFDQAA